MKSVRIGKDINVTWTILTNGQAHELDAADLQLEISSQTGVVVFRPEFTIDGDNNNVVRFCWKGKDQTAVGNYIVTLWKNRGEDGQTAVDSYLVTLVPRTWEEV